MTEMFERLRGRYLLFYRAPDAQAGSHRKIRVELSDAARGRLSDVTIRARAGYIAGTGADLPRLVLDRIGW
jgi:hypothetical protein